MQLPPAGWGPFGPVCGPSSNPLLASWIPDGIWKDACVQHDKCYGNCSGGSKAKCDFDFLKNSGNIFYYSAVAAGGEEEFKKARKHCVGCKK